MGKKQWTEEEREHLSHVTTQYHARKRMKPIAEIEKIAEKYQRHPIMEITLK